MLAAPVVTWKSALTVVPPVGTAQGVLGVVWISVLLLTVLGTSVALRSRRYLIAWFFPLALLLVSIAFGTTETFLPVVRGVLFAVLSVGWLTWRYESERGWTAPDQRSPPTWRSPGSGATPYLGVG